ncbi:MAG TPA: hypothetical protein VHE60_04490 [Pyrinomonadaceae bacterium]|nr:hypothetical protein [Pyrinomonadaceae bacterium]
MKPIVLKEYFGVSEIVPHAGAELVLLTEHFQARPMAADWFGYHEGTFEVHDAIGNVFKSGVMTTDIPREAER